MATDLQPLLSHTLPDKGQVVDDEAFSRDPAQRVAVVTVPRLVKEGVLVDVGGVVETGEGVPDALVGEQGGEPRRTHQQEDDGLREREREGDN